jgi:toxin ParE1/3/4
MSSRRLRIHILDAARTQLSEILLYTEREWGPEQSALYSSMLMETIETLASTPDIGRKRDDLSEGLRSYPTGRHVIYYWHRNDDIVIARVMHRRQHAPREEWQDPSDDA